MQNAEKILEIMDEEESHLVDDITELDSQQEQAEQVEILLSTFSGVAQW